MMLDYDYMYSLSLYKKLKEMIKGGISVFVKDGFLYVIIKNGDNVWEWKHPDKEIHSYFDTSVASAEVYKEYRKYVYKELTKRFFM